MGYQYNYTASAVKFGIFNMGIKMLGELNHFWRCFQVSILAQLPSCPIVVVLFIITNKLLKYLSQSNH